MRWRYLALRAFRVAIVLAIVGSFYYAFFYSTSYGFEHSPWITGLAWFIGGVIFLGLSVFANSRLGVTAWRWAAFAGKFSEDRMPLTGIEVQGTGIVDKCCYLLSISADKRGILLRNAHATRRQTALISWDRVTKLREARVTKVNGKECDPFLAATIYLWEPTVQMLIPWHADFDAFVPESAGFENIGDGQIK